MLLIINCFFFFKTENKKKLVLSDFQINLDESPRIELKNFFTFFSIFFIGIRFLITANFTNLISSSNIGKNNTEAIDVFQSVSNLEELLQNVHIMK